MRCYEDDSCRLHNVHLDSGSRVASRCGKIRTTPESVGVVLKTTRLHSFESIYLKLYERFAEP